MASEKASPDATTAVRPAGQRLRSGDTLKISFFEMLDIPRDTNSSDGNVLVESSDPAGARKAPDKMDILRTFYQRIDLTGEYVIEADGMIVLPRLGPIRAEGLTTSELREVALAAFQKVMSQPGDVNIAILKRQPIYVVGLTQSSGSFQMVPDMMVLHAVALAGGLKREALEAYRVSQYVTETSKLKQARDLLGRLLARRAALTAAYNGDADTDVTPPTQLVALVGELEAAMLQSQERRRALHAISISNNERNALVELAEHLQNRVKMLGKRKSEITNESEKRRERLDEMNALMKRGVINSQRSEVTETNYFQILSRRDDIQSEEQKTIFDLAQAEAAIKKFDIQLRATRLEKLAALDAEISIASNQVASTEMVAGVLRKLDERSKFAMSDVIYKIIRRSNGGATVITADETTLLQPGDVLRVSLRETRPAETSAVEANPGLDRTIR